MNPSVQGPGWRSWAGLVAAPAAWIVHHQVGSDLNFTDCRRGDTATLVLIGVAALIVAMAGGVVSYMAWRGTGASLGESQEGSGRFIAVLALMISALLSLTIIVQVAASLILPPCFR
jgi:hypothetical protein